MKRKTSYVVWFRDSSNKEDRSIELEVAETKMLRFSHYISGTAHVRCFGDKTREDRLRWFGHVDM